MTEPMICAACQHENPADNAFCGACGRRLALICGACGNQHAPQQSFCGKCGQRLSAASTSPQPSPPAPAKVAAQEQGERRQLTVLFCDLVGSTELASRLDAEEYRDVVGQYHGRAGEVIGRYGGYVAQRLGDGLLVYFGWPQTRDDEAERAVRAGLALVDATKTITAGGAPLAIRVGLHTGSVVVSDIGSGARKETLAVGNTPNIASRVQAVANPGEVMLTAATHQLVSGLFLVEGRGAEPLKDIAEPIALYRAVQPSGVRGRLAAAAAARGLTPFVGREAERQLLRSRFEQACEGEGQMVLLIGETGIGKSRLAQVLHDDLAGTPHTWLETGATPYFATTPFHPIIELLKQFFAWDAAAAPLARSADLAEALRAAGVPPDEALPLLAPLLDLPVPPGYPPVLAAPEVAHRRLLAVLAAWMFGVARRQPMVVLLEDLQWVDPSTLALQQLLVEQGATEPLLLLYTARPDFTPPWLPRAHHTRLMLNRLPKQQVQAMVAGVVARGLAADVVEAVIARTDGVPLFVEELTKTVLELGSSAAAREIPATLADSLMGRLDRLGSAAKEVAQVGAVCGREFSYALVRAVHPIADRELEASLAKLADAELLYPHGLPPDATYTFKHALVQDTAYGSLLRRRRAELHSRVAAALATDFGTVAEAHPELLARHYTEAGELEPAVAAWQRAGDRGIERRTAGEAERHLRRGLEVLAGLPAGPERDQLEFQLQLSLGQASFVTNGYSAPETVAAFERARALGERGADPIGLVVMLLGLWAVATNYQGPLVALPLADQVLAAAERAGLPSLQVWAHFAQGATRYPMGDLLGARDHFARALALYDEGSAVTIPVDPRVATLSLAADPAALLGCSQAAREYVGQALAAAQRSGRPADRAWAEQMGAVTGAILCDPAMAMDHATRALAVCGEEPNPVHEAAARMIQGWAQAEHGQAEQGLATLRVGLEGYVATRQRRSLELFLGFLADAHARAGDVAGALRVLAEAEGVCPGEEIFRADTLRRRAELLTRQGAGANQIDAVYRDALVHARRHGARGLELRVAESYAAWLGSQDRTGEGAELLAPLRTPFAEAGDTRQRAGVAPSLHEIERQI